MNGATALVQGFDKQEAYPCPACRLGQVQALFLMDAMVCSSCRHIFTVDQEKQRLLMVDCSPPLDWHWNGRNWIGAHVEGMTLDWKYWLIAAAFVLLPPILVGVTAAAWVAAPDSPLPLLSIIWVGLTFLLHLTLIGCSVIGFYRFPITIYFSTIGNSFL